MGLFNWKRCKNCGDHIIIGSKKRNYWILACDKVDRPIEVEKEYKDLNYYVPKWCPKR